MKAKTSYRVVLMMGLLAMAGCKQLDTYEQPWAKVELADSRASVQAAMGEPSSVNMIELPLIKVEQDAWKSITGKVYLGTFFMGRLVAKNIVS